MRTRSTLLLVAVVGIAGFLAGWSLMRSSVRGGLERDDSAATRPSLPPTSPSEEPPVLDLADSRVPALTLRPTEAEAPAETRPSEGAVTLAVDPADPRTLPESTLEEMTLKVKAIRDLLGERSTPILNQRFESGLYEHVSDERKWSSGDDPEAVETQIYSIHMGPGRGTDRVVLPRSEYPELYALKDETLRLDALVRAEERKRMQQAAAAPK